MLENLKQFVQENFDWKKIQFDDCRKEIKVFNKKIGAELIIRFCDCLNYYTFSFYSESKNINFSEVYGNVEFDTTFNELLIKEEINFLIKHNLL